MSVGHYKGQPHHCDACGRTTIHAGCICNEKQRLPQANRPKPQPLSFFQMDHFGLMEKYKEEEK